MAPPVHNHDGDAASLSRALAHLEMKHEETSREIADVKQDVADVKKTADEIKSLLVGETEEPEKSLVWRVRKLEDAQRFRNKITNWILAGALTTLGGIGITWAVSKPPSASQGTENKGK